MTKLILASRKCDQCLCTPQRIVPKARAQEIIGDCLGTRNHFVCHKSPEGEIVHCRGVHDLHSSRAYLMAKNLGIPIEERDMDAEQP